MRLGSSCSDSVSLRMARPSRIRFGRSVSIGTLRIVGAQSVVRCLHVGVPALALTCTS